MCLQILLGAFLKPTEKGSHLVKLKCSEKVTMLPLRWESEPKVLPQT